MSERIVICSSARQAAEFLHEERRLNPEQKKSVWERLGSQRSKPDNLQVMESFEENTSNNKRKRQQQRLDFEERPKKVQGSYSNPTLLFRRTLIGDSIALRMARAGTKRSVQRTALCQGGATTATILNAVRGKEAAETFSQEIILMVGANDVLKGYDLEHSVANYKKIIEELLQHGIQCNYVVAIPPMAVYKSKDINLRIKNLNSKIYSLQEKYPTKVVYVDAFSIFIKEEFGTLLEDLHEKFYYSGRRDLVHPNKKGLNLIINALHQSMLCFD